jgi:tRNA pseudouridine synthase 10
LKLRKSQRGGEVMSRMYFEKYFTPENIEVAQFRKLIPIPPEPSMTQIRLEKIDFTGPTTFLAGRYNKFSRTLSQTPWVVNGKKLADESVEEIIVDVVLPHFKVNTTTDTTVTFMSSGREDVDVRCLGRGRPFALEIANARTEVLDLSSIAQIEQKVRQSSLVAIRDVQMVRR